MWKYALHCGIGNSIRALGTRVDAVANLLARRTPEPILRQLAAAQRQDPGLGIEGIHIFTFGGVASSADWDSLSKGVLRRILTFARPYRALISLFVGLVAIAAALAVAPPLLFKVLIDDGVLQGNQALIIQVALVVAALAIAQAVLGLIQRWCSSKIGEGLIFDLRTRVFDHVQQMPVAFFTRTQTGALVSRLNSDVIGAQQAFTSTLSDGGVQPDQPGAGAGRHVRAVWQITLAALVLLPLFLHPGPARSGRRLAGDHPGADAAQRGHDRRP